MQHYLPLFKIWRCKRISESNYKFFFAVIISNILIENSDIITAGRSVVIVALHCCQIDNVILIVLLLSPRRILLSLQSVKCNLRYKGRREISLRYYFYPWCKQYYSMTHLLKK